MSKTKPAEADSGFEASLKRLETLVREMETGDLPLEQLMKHFEEGTQLAASCNHKLNEVEKKIERLVKKGSEIVAEPFDEEPADTQPDD